jgi:7TM diverse intracellular signalling/7TMR-DISM extracellular 2
MVIAMNHSRWLFILSIVLCLPYLLPKPLYAAVAPTSPIVGQIGVLEDPSTHATIDQILATAPAFADLTTFVPNFGITTSAYWLRIPVRNPQPEAATFYIDIKYPIIDSVTLYVVGIGGVQSTTQSGTSVAQQLRPYRAPTLVLPFPLAANEAATVYMRVYTKNLALYLPFSISGEQELEAMVTFTVIFSSAILGLMGAMILYNFFIFLLLKVRLYLYYVLYLLFVALGIASMGGFGHAYLYPSNTWLGGDGIPFVVAISYALMIVFAQEFLNLRAYPWLARGAQFLIAWAFLLSVASFFLALSVSYQIIMLMIFIYSLFCLFAGVIAWRRGRTEARFFIAGQIFSWISLMVTGLAMSNVIAAHLLIGLSPALAAAVDAMLFSLALGDRIRVIQRARIAAEEQARRNLEIRSEELERLVVERTAEIKTLHGILPICANCKKIRTDDGAWQALETYLSQHTDAQFSHGICTDCMTKLYPKFSPQRKVGAD